MIFLLKFIEINDNYKEFTNSEERK